MRQFQVLGIGSPHGDDRIGWQVVEALEGAYASPEVNILALDRPGPNLLHYLDGATGAVLVDAMHGNYAPGTIVSLSRRRLLREASQWSSHLLGIPEALALGDALDLLPDQLLLLGIQSHQVEARTETLSPVLEKVIPEAVARIRAQLAVWLSRQESDSQSDMGLSAGGVIPQPGG